MVRRSCENVNSINPTVSKEFFTPTPKTAFCEKCTKALAKQKRYLKNNCKIS